MKILSIILIYFIQPVFWIGIVRSYLNYTHRLRRTRSVFDTAVISKNYELIHFFSSLLVLGGILSLLSWITEVTLPLAIVLLYEGLMALSLLLIPWTTLPVTLTGLIMILAFAAKECFGSLGEKIIPVSNYILLTSAIILATGGFMLFNGGRFKVPRQFKNERDNLVAGYPFKELTIAPMMIMVPGGSVHHLIPFYPLMNLDGHSTAIILLPVLLGLRLTIFRHIPKLVFQRLGIQTITVGVIGIMMALLSQQWPMAGLVGLVVILVLFWLIMLITKYLDLHRGKWVSQVVNGLRIVGIEPNTPASRMDLHVGDIILNANYRRIYNEEEFYEALQSHPTYCRLRVLNMNQRIIITGTAVFNDAPHDLGVVPFNDSDR